jgi:hypothetical protein
VTAGRRLVFRVLTGLVLVVGAPRAALACPVCFGASDSLLASGMNNGILALLAVTLTVLAAFGAFFIYLMRRAKAAQQSPRLSRPVEQGGNG